MKTLILQLATNVDEVVTEQHVAVMDNLLDLVSTTADMIGSKMVVRLQLDMGKIDDAKNLLSRQTQNYNWHDRDTAVEKYNALAPREKEMLHTLAHKDTAEIVTLSGLTKNAIDFLRKSIYAKTDPNSHRKHSPKDLLALCKALARAGVVLKQWDSSMKKKTKKKKQP